MSTTDNRLLRCFIAFDIPTEIKTELTRLQDSLKRLGASVSWTHADGIHLTLKFLGEVNQAVIPKITEAMSTAAGTVSPFPVVAQGVGCFPNPRRPRVLWVGLDGGEPLVTIQEAVEKATEPLGFERENRKFHPHLTLGRVRRPEGIERVVRELERQGFPRQEFRAHELRLMKSDLKPGGAVYSQLHSVELFG